MAENLPEGLVSTNEEVTSDLQSFNCIEVEDIKRFWRGKALFLSSLLMAGMTEIVICSILG